MTLSEEERLALLMKAIQEAQVAVMPLIEELFPGGAIMAAVIFPSDGKTGIVFSGNTPRTQKFIDFVRDSYMQNLVTGTVKPEDQPRIILQ
jgi:hypothetical protein